MRNYEITDSHVHFWNPDKLHYKWLVEAPVLSKKFETDAFAIATNNQTVTKIVFVQADCLESENEREVAYIMNLATSFPAIKAIVAGVPMEHGKAIRPLLQKYASNPIIKGVRRLIQDESDDFCISPSFIEGIKLLPEYDLSFDICVRHWQLESVIKLVEQCPKVTFVLDHLGKPDIEKGLFEPWASHIEKLASFPTVWCKLSGMVTEANQANWQEDDLKPYLHHTISAFGLDRVFYGSDWPVITLASSYERWISFLTTEIQSYGQEAVQQILSRNGSTFYRI